MLFNYFTSLLENYVKNTKEKEIASKEFEQILQQNLYLITLHLNRNKNNNKDIRIEEYFTVFRRYYFHLCQDIFDNKIKKNRVRRPACVGFYDQEGTRVWKSYTEETLPHIHGLLLFVDESNNRFESIFEKNKNYGIKEIRTVDFVKCYSEKNLEKLFSYLQKFNGNNKANRSYPAFEFLPKDYYPISFDFDSKLQRPK